MNRIFRTALFTGLLALASTWSFARPALADVTPEGIAQGGLVPSAPVAAASAILHPKPVASGASVRYTPWLQANSTIGPHATATITSTAAGGNWSATTTWVGGVLPGSADAVVIADGATVTIDTSPTITSLQVGQGVSGILQYDATAARTLTVSGSVTVSVGGTFRTSLTGAITTDVLSVGANLTNNGTLNFSTNGNTDGAGITFTGAASNTFGGAGATTNIRTMTITKTANTNVLELNPSNFTVQGTNTDGTPMAFLTLTSGTFKISGTFTMAGRVFTAAGYTVPAAAGFWLNNPNFTVSAQNGTATYTTTALLHVSAGTYNVGTAIGNSVSLGSGATVVVDGGAINVAGRFAVGAATNNLNYTQTAGTITVGLFANSSTTLATFDLGTGTGADPVISGGTIIISRPDTSATPRDYRNEQGNTGNGITGGTVQFGNAQSGPARTFRLTGIAPNVVIDNSVAGHTLTTQTPQFFTDNALNVTVPAGATFNIGNLPYLESGTTLTNNGILNANAGTSARFIWFNSGACTYQGTGTATANSWESQSASVTHNQTNNVICRRIILFVGNFINSNKLTLGLGDATVNPVQIGNAAVGPTAPTAAGTFDLAPNFNLGTGGETISYMRTTAARTTGPEINPGRILVACTLDDSTITGVDHPLTLAGGDLTVTTLTLSNGRFTSGLSNLILASGGTVTRTNGFVNGFFRKSIATGASVSSTFEVGDAASYTPVTVLFASVTGAGTLTARSTAGDHPNISTSGVNAAKSVNRYWTLTNGGTTFTTYNPTFTFVAGDVDAGANTANFNVRKFNSPNWAVTTTGTRTATTTQATGISSFSDFQVGETIAPSILSTAGTGGAISPSGTTAVAAGGSQNYTITPDGCHTIADVQVDGSSVGAVSSYTFTNVLVNHTISASFNLIAYTIVASTSMGGSISPSGNVSVNCGSNQTFTITPAACNAVSSLQVDGSPVGAATSYTFNNVSANHTITASFGLINYSIVASAGAGGAISPSGTVTVGCGSNQSFTMSPDGCHTIADVQVDGSSVGAVSSYTFNSVSTNHTISASFNLINYSIVASAGSGGGISPSGTVTLGCGSNQSFSIAPDGCHTIADVVVDGSSVGAVASYTFNNVTANHTIAASFTATSYAIDASAGAGGSISPSGTVPVICGSDQAFTISADGCHTIADVLVDGGSVGAVASYTFNNVTANHTIAASFDLTTYAIDASAGPGGAISPSGTVSVNCGANQSFTISPDGCHTIADVLVDGASVGAVASYTFANLSTNHTIAASFALKAYTIVASTGTAGGSISPSGNVSVACGSNQTFTMTPDACHTNGGVLVDGSFVGVVSSYTFTSVTANHTITAGFTTKQYAINVSFGAGGSINPPGTTFVSCGSNQSFTIHANDCYSIADVLVDGSSVGAVSSYTFTNVTSNHSISASFSLNTYTIAASAGAGGSISPNGNVSVNCGANQPFTIAADACYSIADVLVDGSSVGAVAGYTFSNVTTNHTIAASFSLNSYTIAASAGAGGSISPSGDVSVNCGANQSFSIAADGCHAIADVLVDGGSVGAVASYTFSSVSANHTITASFSLNAYTIAASAGAGGSISPSGNVSVNCGGDQAFTIAGDGCHSIADVVVDGVSRGAVASYTFNNVTGNHTIAASFSLNAYTIVASAGAGGSISPSGNVAVSCGGTQAFTITHNSGYYVADVQVDGGSVGGVSSYTFTNVTTNHTIAASFALDVSTIMVHSTSSVLCPTNTCVTLPVTLSRNDGTPVLGYSVTFQLNGLNLCSGTSSITEGSFLSAAGTTLFHVIDNGGGSYTVDDAVLTCGATASSGTLFSIAVGSSNPSGPGTVTITALDMRDCANANLPTAAGPPATVPVDNAAPSVTVTAPNGGESWIIGASQNITWTATDNVGVANVDLAYSTDGGATYPNVIATGIANSGSYAWTVPNTPSTTARVRVTAHDVNCSSGSDASDANFTISPATRTILASAGAGGAITPSGTVAVAYGGNQSFTITPNACYSIADVQVDGGSVGAVASYTFSNVTIDHTIAASFSLNAYTIVASAGAGGSISPSGNVSVNCGSDQAFTIAADGCHAIADVIVDGSSVGAVSSYTFNNVTANHTIAASFSLNSYTIVASAGAGGSISPSGNVSVSCGGSQAFTIAADGCHTIADVVVDGSSAGAVASYTFNNVTANHTIAASFSLNSYTIVASAGTGGSISPNGNVSVSCGSDQSFTVTPSTNYSIADVVVDGSSVGAVAGYTFNNVTANHTITASFSLNTYTIVASAGAGGSISPSGNVSVSGGSDQSFTITPSACYSIADVVVDGASRGAVASYTFNNVTANHTITASFSLNSYTIVASAGTGGSISPNGNVSVSCGSDQAFTIAADACHTIADVVVDGSSVGAVSSYTFSNVTANHTIAASFALTNYTIVASAGSGGSIAPSGNVAVGCGGSQSFTIAADACHHIADVVVDGGSQGAVASYTFANVTANHTITASFANNASAVGAVTALSSTQVKSGNDASGRTKITLTLTAPGGAASIEVWRKGFGSYPTYDDGGGSVPTLPASYPPAGWTLTSVTASGQTDQPATRDFWYYVAYAKDACGAAGPVSNLTAGTLDYHLGDVSNGVTAGQGDNVVTTADISLLGSHYGLSSAGYEYLDVGPTTDRSTNARPTTDNKVDFEDLVMFALNYTPHVSLAAMPVAPHTATADGLSLVVPEVVNAGDAFDVPVNLAGAGDLQALSVTLGWNSAVVQPTGVDAGDLVVSQGGVVLSPGPGRADAALLGGGQGMSGQGAVAVVHFVAVAAGVPRVSIASVTGRNSQNQDVAVAITNPLAVEGAATFTAFSPIVPNPSRGGATQLQYSLAKAGPVSLAIYSVDGRLVKSVVREAQSAGTYRYVWNGADDRGGVVKSGMFYVRFEALGVRKTRTLTLMR